MIKFDELFVNSQKCAYILEDGTIIKLSPFNPSRMTNEIFSEGQVIHFFEQDIFKKSDDFDYEPVKPVKFEGEENKLKDKIGSDIPAYEGVVQSIIEFPNEINISVSSSDELLRLYWFNEVPSQEFAFNLFKMVVKYLENDK